MIGGRAATIRARVVAAILVAAALLVGASPVLAGVGPPGTPRAGAPPSELTLTNLGPGHAVRGFIGPVGSTSDPAQPYPTTIPAGFTAQDESFAGVILATPAGGGAQLQMYCINIRTPTGIGYGYNLGTWDAANVSNVGFVARLLNTY
jgi:hypothetical protein